MRILVTGATGHLGRALIPAMCEAGHDLTVIVRKPLEGVEPHKFSTRVREFQLDRDHTNLAELNFDGFDVVLRLATCYGRSGEDLSLIFESNVIFPLKILEIALKSKVSGFINIDTALPPCANKYALSKFAFTRAGRFYASESSYKFVNVKLYNLYGPGDRSDNFVPHLIRECLANSGEINLSGGEQIRDYIYIADAVSAITSITGALNLLGPGYTEYELGSAVPIRLRDLACTIKFMTASKSRLQFGAIPYRENEDMYMVANVNALSVLGWMPRFPLEAGLAKTIDSFKQDQTF